MIEEKRESKQERKTRIVVFFASSFQKKKDRSIKFR
jgi:hypothetical protein